MVEFPEIARRRLQQGLIAGPNHPDPGLLTAFVEGSLPDRWRNELLDHLAACSSCNELVLLTATEPVIQNVAVKPVAAQWNWQAWMPLRWASVAAAAAVIAGAVWIGRTGQTAAPSNTQVAVVSPATTSSRPITQSVTPSVPNAVTSRVQGASPHAPRTTELAKSAPPATDRALPRFRADAANVAMESGAQPAPPSHDMYQTAVTSSATPEVSNATPATATPSPANSSIAGALASVPPSAPSPQWSVSSGGVLQRSLDGGKTWYPAMSSQPAFFRAAYGFGNEVWVGGNDGVLLHSTDAGHTWNRVIVTNGDERLTADIIRITFASPERGVLVATDNVTWMTADAGRNWRPLR
jgi:hypothetical protein